MKAFEQKPLKQLKGHDLIVARSRALHRAVAEKIRVNPGLISIVRGNLERWIAQEGELGSVSPALLEWKTRLETLSLEEILYLISSESEEADRLRHATPSVGQMPTGALEVIAGLGLVCG